ncbi:tetratricopeptide repeat protein [Fodinibius sp. Rm-B-1B1-1]|uniref:tetratricopeptide repeat protein n=1 Tax=Fodinibius alkaliphilus TaxID=3140241 RepID=UPI003159A6D5
MRKLILSAALLVLSSSLSFAQSEQASVEPPSGMSEIQAYSIFYENYKNDSYEESIKFGRWMWQGMPETIEGYSRFDLKRNLGRLVTAYNEVAQKKEDPSLKEAYVDTALQIFDKAFNKYSDDTDAKFDWYIKRGRLFQTHSDMIDNASLKAAEDYHAAFKLKPEELTKTANGYYVQRILNEFSSAGKKDEALAVIEESEPYASQKLLNSFSDIRNNLFESPEERIAFLKGELEKNPEDEEILSQLRDIYQDQEMASEARKVSEKLYELNPNFDNVMAVAKAARSNANYDMAIKYYKEAIDKASTDKERAEIALNISDAYLNKDELQSARQFAREALDYNSGWGDPYIQIADIYARTVSVCTGDRKLTPEDKAVYWLVLDYLDKAKQTDPNTANEVERKYESYEPVTPSKSEQFFWKPPLEEGESFDIDSSLMDCYAWINETTTVR